MSPSTLKGARRQRAAIGSLIGGCLVGACSTAPFPEGSGGIDQGPSLAFVLPVTSMIGRRYETVVRQRYDFSCGSAALATLLTYHYGDPQDERSAFLGMWQNGDRAQIRRQGFSLLDMKRFLSQRGIPSDGYELNLEQVAAARIPGIALINFNGYRHFVVVKGVEGRTVILGDPSLGLRREDRRTFEKQWNGVYFAINGRLQEANAHFNQASDRERAPPLRFYPEAEPLSIAGLALIRPLPGEF